MWSGVLIRGIFPARIIIEERKEDFPSSSLGSVSVSIQQDPITSHRNPTPHFRTTMSDENNIWIIVGCSLAVLAATSLSYEFIEPNRGEDWKCHAVYTAVAVVLVILLPAGIESYVFTELSVTLVGCVYPIYRATKAVCTPDEGE